jgi:hypothetical protein
MLPALLLLAAHLMALGQLQPQQAQPAVLQLGLVAAQGLLLVGRQEVPGWL